MDGSLMMFLIFILLLVTGLSVNWYNKKYGKKINGGLVIILVFISIALVFYWGIKNMATGYKENLIQNVALKNTIVEIITNNKEQYYKDMRLDDGQVLPMPEEMNRIVQVGDSIYKSKGNSIYTVVNSKTKVHTNFEVKVHERLFSKPQ